jgi:hypothetical protein
VCAYRFDMPLHTLTSPTGERVAISNGEFRLLIAFLSRPQRILSRDQLLDLSRLRSTDVCSRCAPSSDQLCTPSAASSCSGGRPPQRATLMLWSSIQRTARWISRR